MIKQYVALLSSEGLKVLFDQSAISEIAKIAYEVNSQTENIGARRLYTILEKLLQDLFFEAPELGGKQITIDETYVKQRLQNVVKNQDLSRYIL